MASGTITLNDSSATAGGGVLCGKVEWSARADAAANASDVTAVLYCRKGGTATSATSGTFSAQLTVAGETTAVNVFLSVGTDWMRVAETTVRTAHTESGSGSCEISAWVAGPSGTLYAGRAASGGGTAALDAIARASRPTASASGWKLGQSGCGVRMNRKSEQFYHRVRYAFGALTGQTAGLVDGGGKALADGVQDFVWFVPPKGLANQIPNALSGVCTFTVTTYRDAAMTQQVGGANTCTATLYVSDEMQPAVSALTVTPVSTAVPAEWGVWAQGLTRAAWSSAAAGSYGSTIVSRTFSMGSASGSGASGQSTLLPAGTLTPRMTVRDSRGRSASLALPAVTVLPYGAPVLKNCAALRCTSDGTADASGTYLKLAAEASCSPLGENNSVSLRWRFRAGGGNYGGWQPLVSGQVSPDFAADTAYSVQISAIDSVDGEKCVTFIIPAASATLHLRAGGKAVGIGKYAEQDDLLDVAWDTRIRGKLALNELGDFVQKIFGRDYSAYQSVTSYPAAPGIYRTVGTEIFAHLAHPHGLYGVLLICKAGYAMHLYLDHVGRLFYGRSSDTYGEPEVWRLLDGIEAEGTSGIWTYRKYASGIAECWGRQTCSGEAAQAWGSLYALVSDAPSYPITFAALPVVERSLTQSTGSSCWISGWSAESATNPGRFALVRPTTATISAAVSFYVRGKWK